MNQTITDANIILGHLVRGESYLDTALKKYELLVLPTLVVSEVIYVLENEYKLGRRQILEALVSLLRESKIKSERMIILNSLLKYRDNPTLSFVDCYLWELAEGMGSDLLTNDKKLAEKL